GRAFHRWSSPVMLADQGFLELGQMRFEYRMIGPRPDAAPTLVLLHEGLGCVAGWGSFAEALSATTGTGVFVYSRAGYGSSTPVKLPRPVSFMQGRRWTCLPACSTRLASAAGFSSGTAMERRLPRSTPGACRTIACAGWS